MVSTAPNLMIPRWKHLSLLVWSIYIKDRWVTRWEETAISILPQEQLTTILLFWETVIVIWQTAPPHFLRQCTDQPGRVSPHKTARSISSLECALSASQFCHWLPLFSLRTPHLPPPRLLMASIAFNNRGLTGLDKGSWELPAQDGQTYHKLVLACHLNVQLKIYVRDPFGTPGHVKSQL